MGVGNLPRRLNGDRLPLILARSKEKETGNGAGFSVILKKDYATEVIPMNNREEQGTPPMAAKGASPEEVAAPGPRRERARMEKKRRKVSLIAALVVNVVTVMVVAIVIVAILLPGYRRSFTAAKAIKGADGVLVLVKNSEANMRDNKTDFIRAQDGLKNSLQELVESGGDNVYAYVRDNYPDRMWVEENLPQDIKDWLKSLFPQQVEETEDERLEKPAGGENATEVRP